MKITGELEATRMVWVLSYVQERVAETWKDNLLDELSKGELKIETAEKLFSKIRNEFGEIIEEERKIEQLRTIKQERRTCDKYV